MAQIRAAQQALMQGQLADAQAKAKALAQALPNSPDVALLNAMVFTKQQQFETSEQWFKKALSLAPDNVMILGNFGQMQRRAGRLNKAIECFERITKLGPSQANGFFSLAQTRQMAGYTDQAIISYQKAVALKPDFVGAWQGLSQCHRRAYDYEQAEHALAKALTHAPKQPKLLMDLGTTKRLRGHSDAALDHYLEAEQAGLADPELMDAKAGVLLDLGRTGEAIALAKKTVNDHPNFIPGHRTLANLLWEYGEAFGESLSAEEAYLKGLSKNDSVALKLDLVRFLCEARDYRGALNHLEALSGDPHPLNLSLRAHALEGLNQTEQAAPLYQKAYEHYPQHVAFLNDYCRHLIKRKDFKAAQAIAETALRIQPLDQEALAYLGTIWRMLDDEREFWMCDYDRIITIEPIACPAGYDGIDQFLATLTDTLNGIHQASREPVQQSLRNGSQTAGRLFGRTEPIISETQQQLTQSIEAWLSRLPANQEHPFIRRNQQRIRYTGSWSVKLWSTGKHVNHIHSEGWISSAFYVTLPPSVLAQTNEDHAGAIQFGQPPVELGLDLEPRRIIHPKPGHVALFPSYMWHGTVPFEDEDPRITMAFDMIPLSRVD